MPTLGPCTERTKPQTYKIFVSCQRPYLNVSICKFLEKVNGEILCIRCDLNFKKIFIILEWWYNEKNLKWILYIFSTRLRILRIKKDTFCFGKHRMNYKKKYQILYLSQKISNDRNSYRSIQKKRRFSPIACITNKNLEHWFESKHRKIQYLNDNTWAIQ